MSAAEGVFLAGLLVPPTTVFLGIVVVLLTRRTRRAG